MSNNKKPKATSRLANFIKPSVEPKTSLINSASEKVELKPVLSSASVDFGSLGPHKIKITKIDHVVIESREYNKIFLANGTTELLSDEELAVQLVK